MRRGPKWELEREAVIENIRIVAQRLGVTVLSKRDYEKEGSFSIRAIQRKWGWSCIVSDAGLQTGGRGGRKKEVQHPCMQACGRFRQRHARMCRTCIRRAKMESVGMNVATLESYG